MHSGEATSSGSRGSGAVVCGFIAGAGLPRLCVTRTCEIDRLYQQLTTPCCGAEAHLYPRDTCVACRGPNAGTTPCCLVHIQCMPSYLAASKLFMAGDGKPAAFAGTSSSCLLAHACSCITPLHLKHVFAATAGELLQGCCY